MPYRGYCDRCDSWITEGTYPTCAPPGGPTPATCRLREPHPVEKLAETWEELRARQAAEQSDVSDFDKAWVDTFKEAPPAKSPPKWVEAEPEEFQPSVTDTPEGRFDHRTRQFTPWPTKVPQTFAPFISDTSTGRLDHLTGKVTPWPTDKPTPIPPTQVGPETGLTIAEAAELFLPAILREPEFINAVPVKSDGGATSYYDLPVGSTELNDLIEHKDMSFARANIFKACYRLGEKDGTDAMYDINKIIFFAERMKGMVAKGVSL